MTEQPADYFDSRMLAITTAGAPVYVYTIAAENLCGIATLDALEVWHPDQDSADRTINAVLDHARRNGRPASESAPISQ